MKQWFFCLSFFLFSVLSVFSEKLLIQDENEYWNIGIADIFTENSEDYKDIYGKTLSAFLYNEFSICKNHLLSEQEKMILKQYLVDKRLSEEMKLLNEKQIKYDKQYFTTENSRKDLKDEIKHSLKLIRDINRYKQKKIRVRDEKEIRFISSAENEKLGNVELTDIDHLMRENSLDYLVHGKLNLFDDIVFVDISLYSRGEGDISTISEAFEISSMYGELKKRLYPFFTIMLGRKWSSLSVNTDDNADIYIDGDYSGTGSISGKILYPGNHTVKTGGTGIAEKLSSVFLEENQFFTLNTESVFEEERLIALNTFPGGADIYYDSMWQGESPVVVNSDDGEIFIRKEGYREKRILVEEIQGNYAEFDLSPELFTQEDYLLKKRNNLYKNLSWFVLSAPVPFFLFAVLNDYTNAYNSALAAGTNQSEIDRLQRGSTYCYYGYYGTLFISISLFVNVIFHLDDYIKAGDILEQEK